MRSEPYPAWVDEYSRSIYQAFTHMLPGDWGPLDLMFSILPALDGSFLHKLHEAVVIAKEKGLSPEKAAAYFPSPSSLNAAMFFGVLEYNQSDKSNRQDVRETFDYFVAVLERLHKTDTWIHDANIVHTVPQIEDILKNPDWIPATRQDARELGKLNNSSSALAYALYRDFFPQETHEVYGPYDASSCYGEGTILVIKEYPELHPVDLWPEIADSTIRKVKVLQIYRGISMRCEAWGLHSIYEGDLLNGLAQYAVEINGQPVQDIPKIKETADYLARIATKHMELYERMSKEDLKEKFLEWLCYQFHDFFKAVDMDWRPTEQMLSAIRGKEIRERFILDSVGSYEEFCGDPKWGILALKDLYLS